MRNFFPSSILKPTRSPLLVSGLKIITFEICIGASFLTIFPSVCSCRLGLTCFEIKFTPSTVTYSSWTEVTLPRLPLFSDLPEITMTSSPVHIRFTILLLYNTSGASDIIFINFSPRSSRAIGPKTRVPIGSNLLFSNTAALLSNRNTEPSLRRTPFFVRTIRALYTSPFLTRERGKASLTETFITSPMPA